MLTAEIAGVEVPVFVGAAAPLMRPHEHAHWFHGRDGLGDRGYRAAAPRARARACGRRDPRLAADAPGLTLVTLGPLTNVALALTRDPGLASKIGRCVVMGGAPCCEGNVTPAAEYNIWVDPEAARMVFRSGLPIEMVGWHVSRGASALSEAEIADILALGTAKARFAIDCNARAKEAYHVQTGEAGLSLADPTAMAVALDRTIGLSWSRHIVEIECASELTRGMTVVDRLNVAADDNNRRDLERGAGERREGRLCWTFDSARSRRC